MLVDRIRAHDQRLQHRRGARAVERILADLAIGADHTLRVAGRRAADVADEPHAFAGAAADVALRKGLIIELDRIVADQLSGPPGHRPRNAKRICLGDSLDRQLELGLGQMHRADRRHQVDTAIVPLSARHDRSVDDGVRRQERLTEIDQLLPVLRLGRPQLVERILVDRLFPAQEFVLSRIGGMIERDPALGAGDLLRRRHVATGKAGDDHGKASKPRSDWRPLHHGTGPRGDRAARA